MKRIEQILHHEQYQKIQKRLDELEKDRIYCGHGVDHALDVARIMYIMVLEEGISIEKELIYAAALLHDLGRVMQYEHNIPHHEAGVHLANDILKDCGFVAEEITQIANAIAAHRTHRDRESSFSSLLYEADKRSRECFSCEAGETCNWDMKKRNHTIIF